MVCESSTTRTFASGAAVRELSRTTRPVIEPVLGLSCTCAEPVVGVGSPFRAGATGGATGAHALRSSAPARQHRADRHPSVAHGAPILAATQTPFSRVLDCSGERIDPAMTASAVPFRNGKV